MEEFRNEVNKIHAPAELIEKTKLAMHQENAKYIQEKEKVSGKNISPKRWTYLLAGAAVLIGIMFLQRPSQVNYYWQTYDASMDVSSYKAEEEYTAEMTTEEFYLQSDIDLQEYTEEDGFEKAEYLITQESNNALLTYVIDGNEYIVSITDEKPMVYDLLSDEAETIQGHTVILFQDESIPVYNAIWEEDGLWIRTSGSKDKKAFIRFTEKILSK